MGIDTAIEGDSVLLLSLVPSHCQVASASRSGLDFSKSLKIVCLYLCVRSELDVIMKKRWVE